MSRVNVEESIPFLNMLRLFTLSLGSADEIYSKRYNLDLRKVREVLPFVLNSVPTDYILSPVGIVIAIININNKTNLELVFKIWLKKFEKMVIYWKEKND